jgi:hypothetical protein
MEKFVDKEELEKISFDSLDSFCKWLQDIISPDVNSPIGVGYSIGINKKAWPYLELTSNTSFLDYCGLEKVVVTHNDFVYLIKREIQENGSWRYKFEYL